jgi:hypothetical protein
VEPLVVGTYILGTCVGGGKIFGGTCDGEIQLAPPLTIKFKAYFVTKVLRLVSSVFGIQTLNFQIF